MLEHSVKHLLLGKMKPLGHEGSTVQEKQVIKNPFLHVKCHVFLMFQVVESLPITAWQLLVCRGQVLPLIQLPQHNPSSAPAVVPASPGSPAQILTAMDALIPVPLSLPKQF